MKNAEKSNNDKVPGYIADLSRYNYVKLNNYFFLYDFEDPLTHLVKIHPKILLAATQVMITLKDKVTIIAGYMNERYSGMESVGEFEAHYAGRAVDFTSCGLSENTLKVVCEASGFNRIIKYAMYTHAEIDFTKEGVKL